MGLITISDMRFYAHHGCFDQEQAIGTHFRVDLRLELDTSKAEVSDNIDDTVSYLDVYQVVKREMAKPSHLLEHVARRICDAVLAEFSDTMTVTACVKKMNPPLGGQMDWVGVEVTATR